MRAPSCRFIQRGLGICALLIAFSALPARADGPWKRHVIDDGSKGADGTRLQDVNGDGSQIGWFEAPPNARNLDQWKWHPLRPVGWTMSLIPADMDGDGDLDVITSEEVRRLGVIWYENPAR